MPATLIIQLIVQYGLPFAIELIKEIETGKGTITADTLLALHQKYGSMSAADYLAQAVAQAAPSPIVQITSPPLVSSPPTSGL